MKKTARNNNESQQSCCFNERHEKENVQCFLDYYYSFTRWHVFPLTSHFTLLVCQETQTNGFFCKQ